MNDFFQNLYGEVPGPMGSFLASRFPLLDSIDVDFLGKSVTNDEIKTTLFDMAPLKASCSDGYHALFFQK